MAHTPGLPARRAALQMIDAVLHRGETLEVAGRNAIRSIKAGPDKALALAIANESLRWLTDLDALIDSATKQVLPPDAKARSVLRLMLAQWLRLDTPPHAVIATALPLLGGGPRRLAHGVFSTLVKREAALPDVPTLPEAVRERWGERAAAIAAGLVEPPPLDLTLGNPAETAEWANRLAADSYAPGHVRLPRGEAVEKIEGYKDGAWWVQDLAASIPARLLGAGEGRHVLDLCAAPGGKTMQLAAAGWHVTALDLSKRRLDLLRDNLKRTGLKASLVRADALEWEPKHRFDAILLDAPCTATGTARRHPDVLHRIGARQIAEMAQLQSALVARAAEWLKPGGVLVYATCSLEREESEEQAAKVALEPMPILPDELPASIAPTAEGWLRTHPGMLGDKGGLDGFFVARWKRA
ncbi:MAG: RsmB/NOP family class I SAM-dependent RNA methyltransferase [Sphingomonadaceae bacterium]|nr:RsmB/NOP family class I SAM-dependent RNA methyltransferase [Sphingomonadaceae bacterium]MCP5383080.1 RsmB/NOP family class I SAM-dependent RNA methyltransferase [Altererythrobacter sp.]MCP5390362.1 RsmB/NOP family class I SAM-dependent RNA methyltransferase [Sphingomonadaceae bacterium]MCP5393257.1 RsmB/NOP family class I SAM-dependent RNA methyltransferase [Sphingomonadaceae bacterium]